MGAWIDNLLLKLLLLVIVGKQTKIVTGNRFVIGRGVVNYTLGAQPISP